MEGWRPGLIPERGALRAFALTTNPSSNRHSWSSLGGTPSQLHGIHTLSALLTLLLFYVRAADRKNLTLLLGMTALQPARCAQGTPQRARQVL